MVRKKSRNVGKDGKHARKQLSSSKEAREGGERWTKEIKEDGREVARVGEWSERTRERMNNECVSMNERYEEFMDQ